MAGVALVLHLANRFGAPFVAISTDAPPALAELPARVAFGAASAAAYALACYAEPSAAVAAAFGGAAVTVRVSSGTGRGFGCRGGVLRRGGPIGLVGRLMERRVSRRHWLCRSRACAPTAGSGTAARYLRDSKRPARHRFASVLAALAMGRALAAGVTLGEWSSWKFTCRRLAPRRRSRRHRLGGPTRADSDEARRVPRSSSSSRSDSDRPPQV